MKRIKGEKMYKKIKLMLEKLFGVFIKPDLTKREKRNFSQSVKCEIEKFLKEIEHC